MFSYLYYLLLKRIIYLSKLGCTIGFNLFSRHYHFNFKQMI